MTYLHYRIQGQKGDTVKVKLSGEAYVRLMDTLHYDNFRLGRRYQFKGGLVTEGAIDFQLPYKGNFHVVVDHNGMAGVVKATVDMVRTGKP